MNISVSDICICILIIDHDLIIQFWVNLVMFAKEIIFMVLY